MRLPDDKSAFDLVAFYATATDYARERLRARGDELRLWAITQAELRRKAVKKLPLALAACEFVFPTSLSAEQCTSEALAAFHASLVEPGCRGLDMTAGLGIDAMTLALKSASVVAIDIDSDVAAALAHNAPLLGVDNLTALAADSTEWLVQKTEEQFGWIFIDPARRGSHGQRLYSLADCAPDVVGLLPELRCHASRLVVKASPMLDVTDTVRRLPGITDVYAVGTVTECKEVVAVVDLSDCTATTPRCHAVTVGPDGTWRDDVVDTTAEPRIAADVASARWVAEPSPAMMKLNAGGWLCSRYGVEQIAASTHLFVSSAEEPPVGFPGRVYKVTLVADYGKRGCAAIRSAYRSANVTTRNFPDRPADVVRRLRIKEGGTARFFVVRDASARPCLIATEPAEA